MQCINGKKVQEGYSKAYDEKSIKMNPSNTNNVQIKTSFKIETCNEKY